MLPVKPVKACDRCRKSKRSCDHLRPSCSRCIRVKAHCNYGPEYIFMMPPESVSSKSSKTTSPVPIAPAMHGTTTPNSAFTVSLAESSCQDTGLSASASASLSPVHPGELPVLPAQPNGVAGLPSPGYPSLSPEPAPRDAALQFNETSNLGRPVSSPDSFSIDNTLLAPELRTPPVKATAPTVAPTRKPSTRVAQQKPLRKRKRTCLSCKRCHTLKVRCDKELPCGRCVASDKGGECYYNYNKGIHSGRFASVAPPPDLPHRDPHAMMAHWQIHHRSRGASHWRELMVKISEIAGPEKSAPLNAVLQNIATNACLSNFSLPGNFPFGTPGASKYFARDVMTRMISDEEKNVPLYIETYLELLDTINPVIDIASFQEELEKYSNNPGEMSLCWMAQFLMVLGLGSFVSSDPEPAIATEFMLAAEACLMQTPFMFRPTLASLKAMTLMVVAKQICNATCWAVDSAFSFLGLLVRAAYTFGLPQDKDDDLEISSKERCDRRHLWLTIRYIEAKVTVCTGMPPVTRVEEMDATHTENIDQEMPDNMHDVLRQAFPIVMYVTSRMNSSDNELAYSDVLKHSAKLRTLTAHASRVCSSELQFMTLDIFLRRCLMVLHRPFAMHEKGPTLYTESYWASLECSLAVLRHYREIYAGDEDTPPGYPVLGRANALDFFSATLTVLLSVMRRERPLTDEKMGATVGKIGIPPRQLIVDTVNDCIVLWEKEKDRTVCYRTTHQILVVIFAMLPDA